MTKPPAEARLDRLAGKLSCHYEGDPPTPAALCGALGKLASGLGYVVVVKVDPKACSVQISNRRSQTEFG